MDLLVVCLLLVASATSVFSSLDSEPWLDWRLSGDIHPRDYDLFLQPDVWKREFDGTVSIEMTVRKETKFLVVNAARLNVSEVHIFVNETTQLSVVRSFTYETNDYFVVETEELMMIGDVKVIMTFRGILQHLTGVMSNGYTNVTTGEHSPMIMTTFKPNYARFAFPNFDDPFFLSRFTITIRHWANCTAVSNMPAESVTNVDSDWTDTSFKRTPAISSFGVSFAVSNYAFRSNTLPDGKTHRIWTRPDLVDQVHYALNVTSTLQGFLTQELGNILSLEKIDQFDVPFTFYEEVLPQLGLIFHSHQQLTYHSTQDQDINEQLHLVNLAIGLSSNYFGGIVSCRGWRDVWLDSALADFYAWKAAAAIESLPFHEQRRKEQILIYDSTILSRPVVNQSITANNAKADDVYHPLTTVKGTALLKMVENILGSDKFNLGIKRYLRVYSHRTALTHDLWEALQPYADASTNLAAIMDAWVYSIGYPVVNIQLVPDNKINITQKRFLLDSLPDLSSRDSLNGDMWYIPINYQTQGGHTGRVWLNKTTADVIDIPENADDSWILFNHDQSGYFRVNYDVALWDKITTQLLLNCKVFTDQQRSQLLSDALNLAEAEELGFDTALSLTMYASKERYLPAWINIYDTLAKIHTMLSNTSDFKRFQKYVLNLTTELMNELEVKDEGTTEQKLLRGTIIPMACSVGHQGCREHTTRLFKAWIEDAKLNAIPSNIRRTVYCNGIAHSEIEFEWNTTFSRLLAQEQSREREDLLIGMTCTRNFTLLDRLLESFISNDTVGEGFWFFDLEKALVELRTNPTTNVHIWDWLKANHEKIDARHSVGTSVWLADSVTRNFNTEAQLQDVRDFFSLTSTVDWLEELKPEIEKTISANIRFANNHQASVSMWLQENVQIELGE